MTQKICRQCRTIYDSGSRCPSCGSEEYSNNFKGKVVVLNPEQSEIAKNTKIKSKGTYAIKLG